MNDFEKFKNDYKMFLEETEKHFECYHSRSNKRKAFDNLTLKGLADGNDLTESIKVALQKYPEFNVSIKELSLSELENYFEDIRGMDLEIRLAQNMQILASRK